MMTLLPAFLADESGQDFIEYTLLLSFVATLMGAILSTNMTAVRTIWGAINAFLAAAVSLVL